jgi:tagaturonate epimerase
MSTLSKFSLGVGDRFGHQAKAQLEACVLADRQGIEVTPVWNKSNREHTIISSEPSSVRVAADAAVAALHWAKPYFCDADHIQLDTVDRFLNSCDFYTIDVADFIGKPAKLSDIESFVRRHRELIGATQLKDTNETITIDADQLAETATQFLFAVQQAGEIYRKIEAAKGKDNFIAEISMDETEAAQSPADLLPILAAIADEAIPIQTIAPKFSGRFNKGVDYAGEVTQFSREITLDMAAIRHAVDYYGLPADLKLSVHSGSDKFSIYPVIHEAMKKFNTGVHLKTAGTTWLEEIIGLAEAGGPALTLAKEIYAEAHAHSAELCAPYATVVDINPAQLPAPCAVAEWTSGQFTSALRHNLADPSYNSSFRQLMHVGFKVAARMGRRYLDLLKANEAIIAKNVTENLYDRHIVPVFLGSQR